MIFWWMGSQAPGWPAFVWNQSHVAAASGGGGGATVPHCLPFFATMGQLKSF